MSKEISWYEFQQKKYKIGKESKKDKIFRAVNLFCLFVLIVASLSVILRRDLGDAIYNVLITDRFERAVNSLDKTEYADTAKNIVQMVKETCKFNEFNYSAEDVFCVANETFHVFNYKIYVFDYDVDEEKNCRDHTVSAIYILRRFGIDAWPVFTNGHVLALVKLDQYIYLFFDPSYGGFETVYLDEYIYGRLD